ncbi:MAG: matrixin family metalloprotease [Patescibacteria group bacterium]
MRRALRIGVTVLLVLAIGVIGSRLFAQGLVTYDKYFANSCDKPLAYRVGTIDTRFNKSSEEVIDALGEAASIWNEALGKELLVYAPNDPKAIPVNLVYDERQQTIAVGEKLDSEKANLDIERQTLDQGQATYKAAQAAYATAQISFEQKYQAYQAEVRAANAGGGATPEEYRRLKNVSAQLKIEQDALNEQANALNQMAASLKTKVDAFNQGVQAVNNVVNAFNAEADKDFDAGRYVKTATSTRITIYSFSSRKELVFEVAHEFGHALGIEHNGNSASVMYPYAKAQELRLSSEDIASLKEVCKIK